MSEPRFESVATSCGRPHPRAGNASGERSRAPGAIGAGTAQDAPLALAVAGGLAVSIALGAAVLGGLTGIGAP